nr:hypothetical protein [uncultured Mediterranean phage uvMED]
MHQTEDWYESEDNEEYLTRVVVDTCGRSFRLYSNLGTEKEVACDDVDQFMDVLELVRGVVHSDIVVYTDPLVKV